MSMDHQEVTRIVLLDLSAAFDTIDHDWFTSYLSNRKQRVHIDTGISDDFDLNCGVPQGSCMDPVLFVLYVSRLYQVIFPLPMDIPMTLNSIFLLDQMTVCLGIAL